MAEIVDKLEKLHLFRNATRRDLERLSSLCQVIVFRAGQTIFPQGAEAQNAMILVSGRLEVSIRTGRQHQIRRHLNEVGHSILGDDLYHTLPPLRSKGLYLFSTHLEFEHPVTGNQITVSKDIPQKILNRIAYEQRCMGA